MKKRMKKLAALALAACMFASITACGSNEQATKEESVKEETVSVVPEVNTESVAEIENENSDADKETEVVATSETEVKEDTEVEKSDSKQAETQGEKTLRKILERDIAEGSYKGQDKEVVEKVKKFMEEPQHDFSNDIEDIEDLRIFNLSESAAYFGVSAEKFEEIYWSINP